MGGRAFAWACVWTSEREGVLTVEAEGSGLRLRVPVWRHAMATTRHWAPEPADRELVEVYACRFQELVVEEAGGGLFPGPVAAGDRLVLRPRVATIDGPQVTPAGVEALLQWCARQAPGGRAWRAARDDGGSPGQGAT
jgi:hypothetical protein